MMRGLRLWLRRVRNALALLALVLLAALAWLYREGSGALERLDPGAPEVLGQLARGVLETDAASASVTRVPLAAGSDAERVVEAMRQRARALGVELVEAGRLQGPVPPAAQRPRPDPGAAEAGDAGGGAKPGAEPPQQDPAPAEEAATPQQAQAPQGATPPGPPPAPAGDARTEDGAPWLRLFRACDAATAQTLLAGLPELLVHAPCRISLYGVGAEARWLAAPDLDLLIHGGRPLAPALRDAAIRMRDTMLDVMTAGAEVSR